MWETLEKEMERLKHELGEILIILENKRANGVVVQHPRLAAQHVAHDGPVALEAVRLALGKSAMGTRSALHALYGCEKDMRLGRTRLYVITLCFCKTGAAICACLLL